jgi:hypothetical protein
MSKLRVATPFILLAVSVTLSVVAFRVPWFGLTSWVEYHTVSDVFYSWSEPVTTSSNGFFSDPLVGRRMCGFSVEYSSVEAQQAHELWRTAGWFLLLLTGATWIALILTRTITIVSDFVRDMAAKYKSRSKRTDLVLALMVIASPVLVFFCALAWTLSHPCPDHTTKYHVQSITTLPAGPFILLVAFLFGIAVFVLAFRDRRVANTQSTD